MMTLGSIVTLSLCISTAIQAPDTLLFEKPFLVTVQGQPISVAGGFAAPAVTDIDNDGLPDLLVGQREEGQLRVFLNHGTRAAPRFLDSFPMQAAGANMFCAPG